MRNYSKYHSKPVMCDGIRFASKKEATRYRQLKGDEALGLIYNLQMQVPFELIPAQRGDDGKVKERAVKYVADFLYFDRNGGRHVEDTKGFRTKEYVIKRKLMLYVYGIGIEEI